MLPTRDLYSALQISPAYPPLRHRLELDPLTPALDPPRIEPALQILALGDVELDEVVAAFDDGFDADAGDADAAADGEGAELEQVEADGAEGGVGDGGAAEGEVEVAEVGAAEGEDFGGGVGEGAAEGLEVVMVSDVVILD